MQYIAVYLSYYHFKSSPTENTQAASQHPRNPESQKPYPLVGQDESLCCHVKLKFKSVPGSNETFGVDQEE